MPGNNRRLKWWSQRVGGGGRGRGAYFNKLSSTPSLSPPVPIGFTSTMEWKNQDKSAVKRTPQCKLRFFQMQDWVNDKLYVVLATFFMFMILRMCCTCMLTLMRMHALLLEYPCKILTQLLIGKENSNYSVYTHSRLHCLQLSEMLKPLCCWCFNSRPPTSMLMLLRMLLMQK